LLSDDQLALDGDESDPLYNFFMDREREKRGLPTTKSRQAEEPAAKRVAGPLPVAVPTTALDPKGRPPLRRQARPSESLAVTMETPGALIARLLQSDKEPKGQEDEPATPAHSERLLRFAPFLLKVSCPQCSRMIVEGTVICEFCDYILESTERSGWSADDPLLKGQSMKFNRGENSVADQMVEEGDPGVIVLYDGSLEVQPIAFNRLTRPGARLTADMSRIRRASHTFEITERDLWSYQRQERVSLEQKHQEDYNKQH